jgi:hypothetical protein
VPVTHGTRSGYLHWKCRCRPCLDAHLAYKRAYRRRGRPPEDDFGHEQLADLLHELFPLGLTTTAERQREGAA